MLKAVLLGVIQAITEWLPVSSTGHLLLFDAIFPLQVSEACRSLFMVLIQLGSILAVVLLYFHRLNPFSPKKTAEERKETWNLWGKVVVASVPVAIVGFLLDDTIDAYFHGWKTIALTLFVYGVAFLFIERRNRKVKPTIVGVEAIDYRTALLVGLFECLALIPGTSRSGSTILGALLLGLDRTTASTFSFFLAIPAMFGASLLKLVKLGYGLTGNEWLLVFVGFVVSFLLSIVVIKALLSYIKGHDFTAFGWYRIVLSVVVVLYFSFFG